MEDAGGRCGRHHKRHCNEAAKPAYPNPRRQTKLSRAWTSTPRQKGEAQPTTQGTSEAEARLANEKKPKPSKNEKRVKDAGGRCGRHHKRHCNEAAKPTYPNPSCQNKLSRAWTSTPRRRARHSRQHKEQAKLRLDLHIVESVDLGTPIAGRDTS